MKKLIFAALVLSMCMSFAACGSVDESSAPAAESSQTTSEAKLENVTIRMDSSKLHEGVEFNDSELLDKTAEFTKNVTENAEEKEPESHETVYGGDWLDIKCSDGTSIYYEARESNYVRIGAKTYYTSDDTAKEFKEYVIDFLENGGYWG
ncbi:hypothetical protein DWW95_03065 [Ruminococcus sp. AF17-6LB]|jgi:opacity protein-like surface antigen|uniref:hypothetical protein n=1 Tax=unclassified Ruminococcus TaxID=2608920 RepID=UPI000E4D66D4|nr:MULTISPECIES: hypothetical protein [unclassified Ruminococcus]RGG73103.1 hypothetical protein DWW95_03065 [Ruminococcus sp. AF17-6LB]RGG74750.1 hypothetical protein DWW94_03060 [Ruminococcus sp. AF17-6]RGG75140.1 hypothetical protein DWW87_02985 [Ruminococcus sp. AF17-24]RGG81532.1 hypothetical protein DWW81_03080 [Ruminococcus sp. AF17-1AC]